MNIQAELSKAEAQLARLRSRDRQKYDASGAASRRGVPSGVIGGGVGGGGRPAASAAPTGSPVRAMEGGLLQQARDGIEVVSLGRDVARLLADAAARGDSTGDDADAAAGSPGDEATALVRATERCTALGLLLLRHPPLEDDGEGESARFRASLVRWHASLHAAARRSAMSLFRSALRRVAPEYPSNERSSTAVTEALSSPAGELCVPARCLVELQAVCDAMSWIEVGGVPLNGGASWRMDVVDELCRPLAERLRFHFLEERTGIMTGGGGAAGGTGTPGQVSSAMDRLPEWLFRYLRETVEGHGVHAKVMLEAVQPLVDSVMDSLAVRESMRPAEDDDEDDEESLDLDSPRGLTTREVLQRLRQHRYGHAPTYFLREVAHMARHALRAKSFFRHPDVVGSECQDRTIALRGIEQLFLFDSFLEEKAAQSGGEESADPAVSPPRLVDTFLSSDEVLLQWWLDEERDGAISALRRCASATLSSHQSGDEAGDDRNRRPDRRQLCPRVSELFVSILRSAKLKSGLFTDPRSCQAYIADVVAPLCSAYLDVIHREASHLRQRLLARPPSALSSGPAVGVLRSANIPSDELLVTNTSCWATLITGTHLSAQAVLRGGGRQQPLLDGGDSSVLDKVGESMERLRDAMVEDFISALVETIVMERAKLASYAMRAPFMLSEPPPEPSPDRRGQRDRDASSGAGSLSPDLNDSIHVASVVAGACSSIAREARGAFSVDSFGTVPISDGPFNRGETLYLGRARSTIRLPMKWVRNFSTSRLTPGA
ncbi:hypothetical protein ACHAWF_017203 [Thalassiosira exigua]